MICAIVQHDVLVEIVASDRNPAPEMLRYGVVRCQRLKHQRRRGLVAREAQVPSLFFVGTVKLPDAKRRKTGARDEQQERQADTSPGFD